MILAQYPDGDMIQKMRKERIVKCVFEDDDIDEAIRLLDKRDVFFSADLSRDLRSAY